MHKVRCNSVALDDSNNDKNRPYCGFGDFDVSIWYNFKEDRTNFKQGEKHQNDEVPKVDIFAHKFNMFAHYFTSIQIECWEDDNPSQVDKVPVETEVFDSLCVVLVKANCVGLEYKVQHDKQANEDVQSVRTCCDVEN